MAEPLDPGKALDKLAFLISFVPYLAERGRVSVAEAAAHFGYPEDFVRRSAVQLTMSGVPGDMKVYLPDDLFDISWEALEQDDEIVLTNRIAIDDVPRLSAREAAALIAGLQVVAADREVAASPAYATLRDKLARGASGTPSALAVGASSTGDGVFGRLVDAIRRGVRVEFDYRNARGTSEHRHVDPLRLESVDADAYLRGWCHRRGAFRTFRLDRMSALEVLDTPVEHTVDELDSAIQSLPGDDAETLVTLELDARWQYFLAGYRPRSVEIDRESGRARAVIAVAAPATIRRLVAEVPGAVVLAPEEAREAIASWARDALDRYRRSGG